MFTVSVSSNAKSNSPNRAWISRAIEIPLRDTVAGIINRLIVELEFFLIGGIMLVSSKCLSIDVSSRLSNGPRRKVGRPFDRLFNKQITCAASLSWLFRRQFSTSPDPPSRTRSRKSLSRPRISRTLARIFRMLTTSLGAVGRHSLILNIKVVPAHSKEYVLPNLSVRVFIKEGNILDNIFSVCSLIALTI